MANDPSTPDSGASPAGGLFGGGGQPTGGLFSDPNLLIHLGLGLISSGAKNSPLRGNWGAGLQQGMENYLQQKQANQQMALQRLQLTQQQQEFPMRMAYLRGIAPQLGIGTAQGAPPGSTPAPPPQGAPSPGSAPGAPPAGVPGLSGDAMGAAPPRAPVPAAAGPAPSLGLGAQGTPAGGNDPMALMRLGAFGGALGMPGASNLQDLAKTQLQYDPKIATRMEAAKSQVAVDQQQIQEALAQGNTGLAAGIAQKMRQDLGLLHIASMSGTQTKVGLGGDISTFNPNEGVQSVNGVESAIPGAAAARGEIAGAVARGEATGKVIELTDPKTGVKYTVPMSSITGGGGGASAPARAAPPMALPSGPRSPSPTAPGAPGGLVAALGPAQSTMLKGNAEQALETNKEFQDQAEGANQMLAQVGALRSAASEFSPGQFAEKRGMFLNLLNSTGLISDDQAKRLGALQEGQKISIQLQASATKQLGSREAAQIFQVMGKSLPNLTLTDNGLQKVMGWQEGLARYNIARAADANQRAQSNDATGVNNVRDTWIKNSNPLYYVLASSRPDVQRELLDSLPNKKAFLAQWNGAAKAGYAPRPNEYQSGGP